MTTTSLPDRLRAVADLIEQHNLPEPRLTISEPEYGTATFDSLDDLHRWAEVYREDVTPRLIEPEGRPAFLAYSFDVTIAGQWLRVSHHAPVAQVVA